MATATVPALLMLPAEVRNLIYKEVFTAPNHTDMSSPASSSPPRQVSLAEFGIDQTYLSVPGTNTTNLAVLLTNRQLHAETQSLYLNTTTFYLPGTSTDPYIFGTMLSNIPSHHLPQIKHIVLTSRIAHLRALNEIWCGLPFGHGTLRLDTLVIVPKRPDTHSSAYAEVADLSQSHTLAYILAETLKTLRNVRRVVVKNERCFSMVVWRLVYRSMVYRLWRWGGSLCGLGFREWENEDGSGFEVLLGFQKTEDMDKQGWRDVPQEICRLIGGEGSRDGMD